jgi:phenylalanyl-tRNA synthetase alpha chain
MDIREQLKGIVENAHAQIKESCDSSTLDAIRVKVLGKKGELTGILRSMGQAEPSERPVIGQMVNDARAEIEDAIERIAAAHKAKELEKQLEEERIDVTAPGKAAGIGKVHPLTKVMMELRDIFVGNGL